MKPATKAAAGASPIRRARLAKVHIAIKQLGLDDDVYRSLLARMFNGRSSAAELSDRQLDELLEHFKSLGFKAPVTRPPKRAGKRPMADGRQARKLRALWLSLYHLGVVRDPEEAALAAWVKRTTAVAALQWLDIESAGKAIEGLKAWATRDGGVDWSRDALGRWAAFLPEESCEPFAVVAAQWARMCQLGLINHPDEPWWGYAYAVIGVSAPHFYTEEDWHRLLENFGRAIRRTQTRAGS